MLDQLGRLAPARRCTAAAKPLVSGGGQVFTQCGHVPQNLDIVRKIAINLLRLNPLKKTLPKKCLRACLDPAYPAQVPAVMA